MASREMEHSDSDNGWISLTSSLYYRREGNVVFVQFELTPVTAGQSSFLGTLPVGYRPSKTARYVTWGTTGLAQLGGVWIETTGKIYGYSANGSNIGGTVSFPLG